MVELCNDFLTAYFIRREKLVEIYLTILFKKATQNSQSTLMYKIFII